MRISAPAEGSDDPRPPSRWLDLAVVLLVCVLIGLGTWQLQRLQWKEGLIGQRQAQLAAEPVPLPAASDDWEDFEFRRVAVTGTFDHEHEQLMGVSKEGMELGRQVLTPLLRDDGRPVLVDRGWVPEHANHPAARRAGQLEGEVTVRGIARFRDADEHAWMVPDNQPDAGIFYWYDMAALREATGRDLLPVVVEADATPNPGGLPIGGRTRVELPNRHLGYVITWYGLAVTLIAVYIAYRIAISRGRL